LVTAENTESQVGAQTRPTVGLFDSGIGGLSVLTRMLDVRRPPWGRILYLADLAHFPYGARPLEEVRRLALAGVGLLAEMGSDVVVVACNTAASSGVRAGVASAAAWVLDIIGPGARYTAGVARDRAPSTVVVLGTAGTIQSGVWERDLRLAGHLGPVIGLSSPHLANLIEEGENGPAARKAVREAATGLAGRTGGETVVLACTHYPFAAGAIARVFDAQVPERPVRIIDPAQALVEELMAVLGEPGGQVEGIGRSSVERLVDVRFLTTGRRAHFKERAGQLLNGRAAGAVGPWALESIVEVALPVDADLPG